MVPWLEEQKRVSVLILKTTADSVEGSPRSGAAVVGKKYSHE
jgi:hypothetical protein